jgi:hypothetical protein
LVHPNPNTVAHGSNPFYLVQAFRRHFFRKRDACATNRAAPLFYQFSSISKTTGHFLWRVTRPARNQLAQLAGDAAVEFQIGPQFDSHGNVPVFRADANQSLKFRMDVHHDSPLFPFPAIALCETAVQIRFQFSPLAFTTLDTPPRFLVPIKTVFSEDFFGSRDGAKKNVRRGACSPSDVVQVNGARFRRALHVFISYSFSGP